MARGKAEDAGGLTPAKDDNTALCHFGHRTLPIFKCVDYIAIIRIAGKCRAGRPRPAVLPQTARRVVAPYGAPLSAILDPAINVGPVGCYFLYDVL